LSDVGTLLPMHCTAVGKVLLAYKEPYEVKGIVAKHGLKAMTQYTITDYEVLSNELNSIRRQGYAVDNNELIEGLRCVAAPIFDRHENVMYSISISGLSNRLHSSHFDTTRDLLISKTENISYQMGYRNNE